MKGFKLNFWRRKEKEKADAKMDAFARKAKSFSDENEESLIIIGDPSTDVIFMAHRGVIAPIRVINKDGSANSIVANALRHRRKDGDIDRFLLAVDGGLFAIAKALYDIHRNSIKGKVLSLVQEDIPPARSEVVLSDGSKLSPMQLIDAKD